MLEPPIVGVTRSVNTNNTDPNAIADWIETSVLFGGMMITDGDILDILDEQQITEASGIDAEEENGSARQSVVDDARTEIETRLKYTTPMNTGGGGYILTSRRRFSPAVDAWEQDPIRAFFLILSMFRTYGEWAAELKHYPSQGVIFEQVCEALLTNIFPTWVVKRVGWAPDTSEGIVPIVKFTSELLSSSGHPDLQRWAAVSNKDAGLDIVAVRQFPDAREGLPAYLIQCASGSNWRSKITTPSVAQWHKYLDTAVEPSAGFTAPFVINSNLLAQEQLRGQSIVLDRLRLLNGCYGHTLDTTLNTAVIDWCRPYVMNLPWMAEA